MTIVNCKSNTENVRLIVSIKGLVYWSYIYYGAQSTIQGQFKDASPQAHNLASPNEFKSDSHHWEVRLVNSSNEKQNYEVDFYWEQNGQKLSDTYSTSGELNAGEVRVAKSGAWMKTP